MAGWQRLPGKRGHLSWVLKNRIRADTLSGKVISKGRNVRGIFISSERRAGCGDEGGENDAFLEVPDFTN